MKARIRLRWKTLLLLCLGSFYFLSVDVLADSALSTRWPEAFVPARVAYLLVMAAGFLCAGPLCPLLEAERSRRGLLAVLSVVSVASLLGIALSPGRGLLVGSILTALFAAGLIGAAVYRRVAMELRGDPMLGRLCALGMGGAAVLQVLASALDLSGVAFALVLAAALGAALLLLLQREPEPLPALGIPPEGWRLPATGLLLAGVAVISLMGGLNDGVLTGLQSSGALDLYALPRLFYFVGMVLAGWVADRFRLRGLSLLVLLCMICATAGALFMSSPATLFLNASIYSLFAGIVIIYFTVPFFHTVGGRNAALWPSLGRAVRLPGLAAGVLLYEEILSGLPFAGTILVYVALSAVLTGLFLLSGQLSKEVPAPTEPLDEEARADRFAKAYGLTPKEREVLAAVLRSDLPTPRLAEELGMGERTLYRHLSGIYDKTGTDSRMALVIFYHRQDWEKN